MENKYGNKTPIGSSDDVKLWDGYLEVTGSSSHIGNGGFTPLVTSRPSKISRGVFKLTHTSSIKKKAWNKSKKITQIIINKLIYYNVLKIGSVIESKKLPINDLRMKLIIRKSYKFTF